MHQLTKSIPALLAFTLCGTISTIGCDGDCVDIDTTCTPLYEPTFDNIYTNTLSVSCSVGNGTCHTSDASAGGLSFASADTAFAMLTDGRVDGGDASCSLLTQRIAATDSDVMPPGKPLPEAERCAITQWINNGAAR